MRFSFEKSNFDNSICTGRSKTEYFELIIIVIVPNIKYIPYDIFSISEIKLNHRNIKKWYHRFILQYCL